jgi:aldehyde:ferredoxin oxidoreductase
MRGLIMFKLLEVDLTNQSFLKKTLSDDYLQTLGGRGLAVRLIWDLVAPTIKPLSPENMIIFSTGALINSKIPMSGRSNATSISPLTNTIFSSNVGGMFGYNLSATGYDVLVIVGESAEPQYLVVDESPRFEDAKDIWGKDTFETTDILMKKHEVKEGQISVISNAGENQNYMGNIMVQKHRAFGRGGMGAILGSKNLKGLVFLNNVKREESKYDDLSKKLRNRISKINNKLKTQGTSGVVNTANRNEAMPTRYFRFSQFEHAENINGHEMENHKVKSATCYSCPVACKMIEQSEKYDIETDGPEYETIVFQGSNLGISNLDAIIKSNHLCDRLGLDTISSGNIMGAFIEAVEMGKLDFDITWDDEVNVHKLIELMATNEGIGAELQRGTNAFCKKYEIEALTVKGLDVPGHDPRGLYGQGLSYATSNRGADHLYSNTYKDEYNHPQRREVAGKAHLVIKNENRNAVLDSLGLCKFSTSFLRDKEFLEIIGLYLEKEVSYDEFQSIGSDIIDMERAFNNKRGFDSKDDVLPKRVNVPDLENELQEYYRLRSWTEDGKVTKKF